MAASSSTDVQQLRARATCPICNRSVRADVLEEHADGVPGSCGGLRAAPKLRQYHGGVEAGGGGRVALQAPLQLRGAEGAQSGYLVNVTGTRVSCAKCCIVSRFP